MMNLIQVESEVTERRKWDDCLGRLQGFWPSRAKDWEEET